MGDINLLGMIRKIKNSLSGYISTSDKATKSKFGIVKVGDNLSVSSGTISVPVATEETYGVVKAGGSGVTIDELWNGTTTTTFTSIASSLTHPINDYKAILVTNGTNVSGLVAPIVPVGESGVSYGFNNLSKEISIAVTTDDVKIKNSGSGGLNPVVLYGIK